MPDRPAGAAEGAQDTGALEAMMAALLFRPAPAPEQTGATPAAPVTSAIAGPSGTSAAAMDAGVVDAPAGGAALAKMAATQAGPDGDTASMAARAAAPDAATEAMRAAARAALADAGALRKTDGGVRDASAAPASAAQAAGLTTGPSGGAAAPAETASTSLGLLEGMSGVEAVASPTTAVQPDVRVSVRADGAGTPEAGAVPARAAPVPGSASMAEAGGGAPVAAAKASGIQSLPAAAQVAETVRAAVSRGGHEVRLLLNPGDLGRIDIRITEQDGVLRLRLDASRGSTRDLLVREMPALQQALESRDLRVERIQVSHSGPAPAGGSGAAWQQGSGRQGQQRERDGPPAWSPVATLAQPEGGQQETGRAPRVIRHHGVLDRVA